MDSWTQVSSPLHDLYFVTNCESETLLGRIYYHTMLVYLSAMFDIHHKIWKAHLVGDCVPTLSSDDVKTHVQTIINLIASALDHSNLVGPLFYLPLRVAGQRCDRDDDRARVLGIISRIAERGFVVVKSLLPIFENSWRRGDGG